ncbi:NAD(P)-binding protein [Corynebacterium uterequi]|uniref:NAD(P)-binding Rossmann-like domain n=1 Tax=Corynebacterium uterequi TaxID=1072256 RepID=A0A0G3HGS2_9CORY|nr:NAD(P)-binding protein [Corynebacterium uterequi]AKK11975.1 hypothetical protein CUTER_10035 [Corynebacterium uterequi]
MAPAPRIAIVGATPAGIAAAEQAVRAGMCVDLFDARPVAHGLISSQRLIDGAVETIPDEYLTPHLRFFGNVRIGHDISWAEFNAIYAAHQDIDPILTAHSLPVTRWHGWFHLDDHLHRNASDWTQLAERARGVPVCF